VELKDEYRITASREQVWEALNDPEILKKSIPGCSALEAVGDSSFTATVTAKVGPVKANFQGQVTLSDIDPPNGYTIQGEGKGGPAGFAKGGAKVSLVSDGDCCLLRYEVEASVGGKLAQIGSRLIDGTAKKLSREFFETFAALAAEGKKGDEAPNKPVTVTEVPPEILDVAGVAGEVAPEVESVSNESMIHDGITKEAEVTKSSGLPTWVWVSGLIIVVAVILGLVSGN